MTRISTIANRALVKFGYDYIDVAKQPDYHEAVGMEASDFIDRSYILWGDTPQVVIGVYTCADKRTLSILHEIGHTRGCKFYPDYVNGVIDYIDTVTDEALAWHWAVRQVRRHCVAKMEAVMWCMDQLRSYIGSEYDEGKWTEDEAIALSGLSTLRIRD